MLLSALLGAIGSVSSVMAQNVYSLNAVGYINITLYPGFNIISCPLIGSPDNSLNTLLNNTSGTYSGVNLYYYSSSAGYLPLNTGVPAPLSSDGSGWSAGGSGTNVYQNLTPGVGVWFQNPNSTAMTVTFVGSVPSGPYTNVLSANGFSLVGSIVPTSGDLYSNSISELTNSALGDDIYVFNGASQNYTTYATSPSIFNSSGTVWSTDPAIQFTGEGFWYYNSQSTAYNWVENYSVSQ